MNEWVEGRWDEWDEWDGMSVWTDKQTATATAHGKEDELK